MLFQKPKLVREEVQLVPMKASAIPNFEAQYKKFMNNLEQKKLSKPTTVIQPFSFDDEIDVSSY